MMYNVHTHSSVDPVNELVNLNDTNQDFPHFSIGIHPWNTERTDQTLQQVAEKSTEPNCVAIGEIGLDKLKGPSLEIQTKLFIAQLELAEDRHLPVIIHCVRSWNEIREIKRKLKPKQPWIYHGFSKNSILNEVIQENIYISIGARILTDEKLQASLVDIPLNMLFLETDDSTVPISSLYKKVSELKKVPLSQLENELENNIKTVFTKWITG